MLGSEPSLTATKQQLKYGDKSHMLQTSSESYRHELYQSSGTGTNHDFTFAGLINHSLAVQKAEEVTAGVDSALEQLKSSMAAISEMKEANKYVSPLTRFVFTNPADCIQEPLLATVPLLAHPDTDVSPPNPSRHNISIPQASALLCDPSRHPPYLHTSEAPNPPLAKPLRHSQASRNRESFKLFDFL